MSYQALHNRYQRIGHLEHACAMLSWDEAAMMPTGGGTVRAEALATLVGMMHDLTAAPEIGDLAAAAANEPLDAWQAANVALIQRRWQRARAVPTTLATAFSKARSLCEQAWRPARGANDWHAVAGPLKTVTDLTRETAQALADALDCSPYDALLDSYEPGLQQADIDPVFNELRTALPPLIDLAIANQAARSPLASPFSTERQEQLSQALMAALGFDFAHGRLDVSHHPFCGGDPSDVRITTRYDNADFMTSMFSVLHETGHALYQQGLPAAWRGQPVGDSRGAALHESQSLFMEMQVCRSRAFLDFAAPIIQRCLLGSTTQAAEWQPDNLTKLAAKVERNLIRMDADELTYPLHVILRYELEAALLDGSLAVADLPDAWDEAMRRYLGLSTAGDFANGVMQDVHWFGGLIGYFPTYTFGAVIAAQLFQAAKARLPNLEDAIRNGDFGGLLEWLRTNIHSQGSFMPTPALVAAASGEELGTAAFLRHLNERYGT